MIDRGVTITLSPDQALLLADRLDRVIGTVRFDSSVDEDLAVWSPLYQLHGTLETTLPEIFAADYTTRLDAARRRLLPTLGEFGSRTPSRKSVPDIEAGEGHHSLFIRRGADGKLAYYLAWNTQPVAFTELVDVAGRRWVIEEMFQITKDQFGLDRTQVRSWHGWHRHRRP